MCVYIYLKITYNYIQNCFQQFFGILFGLWPPLDFFLTAFRGPRVSGVRWRKPNVISCYRLSCPEAAWVSQCHDLGSWLGGLSVMGRDMGSSGMTKILSVWKNLEYIVWFCASWGDVSINLMNKKATFSVRDVPVLHEAHVDWVISKRSCIIVMVKSQRIWMAPRGLGGALWSGSNPWATSMFGGYMTIFVSVDEW